MKTYFLTQLSFYSLIIVINSQILYDYEVTERSSSIQSQKQISLVNYVIDNCSEHCNAFLDYPFVNIQCCEQQLQGTLVNLVRNTTSNHMTNKSIYSKDNLQALVVESLLRVTTYDRSVNFNYKVEDCHWVNQGSMFQNINLFKIGAYSYFIVTIENVPNIDEKLFDKSVNSSETTKFDSKSIFKNYQYDRNKKRNKNSSDLKDEFS